MAALLRNPKIVTAASLGAGAVVAIRYFCSGSSEASTATGKLDHYHIYRSSINM